MDEQQMADQLGPAIVSGRKIQLCYREKQRENKQGQKIRRINAEKTPNEKPRPFPPLLLKTHVNAKSADNEENGHANPSHKKAGAPSETH